MRVLGSVLLAQILSSTSSNRPFRLNNETTDDCTFDDKHKMCQEKLCSAGCGVKYKAGKMQYFFDFDGTIETDDALAHAVMDNLLNRGCGKDKPGKGNVTSNELKPYLATDLIAALYAVYRDTDKKKTSSTAETRTRDFVSKFFGEQRAQILRDGFADLKTKGKVRILSAAWRAIPADAWAGYLYHLISEPRYGLQFDIAEDDVLTVEDPGPGLKSDKGEIVQTHCKALSAEDKGTCVHTDNSIAYVQQARARGYGGMYVVTKTSIVAGTFDALKKTSAADEGCCVPSYTSPACKGCGFTASKGEWKLSTDTKNECQEIAQKSGEELAATTRTDDHKDHALKK